MEVSEMDNDIDIFYVSVNIISKTALGIDICYQS
jgi:hypothetical protein